jgi:hypothetical protein
MPISACERIRSSDLRLFGWPNELERQDRTSQTSTDDAEGERSVTRGFYANLRFRRMNPHLMNDKVFKWASNFNIGYIISFHDFIISELCQKEDELDQAIASFEGDRKGKVDLLVARDLYASTYKQHLMSNTFLLLYSHLEEWLYLIWKIYSKSIKLDQKSRGSISRFKPVLQHALGLDMSQDERWHFLLQAEKIRNCLLHANSRIDLSRDSQELRSLLSKSNGDLFEKNARLYLNRAYVEKFFGCVQSIILRVESAEQI